MTWEPVDPDAWKPQDERQELADSVAAAFSKTARELTESVAVLCRAMRELATTWRSIASELQLRHLREEAYNREHHPYRGEILATLSLAAWPVFSLWDWFSGRTR